MDWKSAVIFPVIYSDALRNAVGLRLACGRIRWTDLGIMVSARHLCMWPVDLRKCHVSKSQILVWVGIGKLTGACSSTRVIFWGGKCPKCKEVWTGSRPRSPSHGLSHGISWRPGSWSVVRMPGESVAVYKHSHVSKLFACFSSIHKLLRWLV